MCLLNAWIGEIAMSGLYEELKDLLNEEKGVALATVVRGETHVGAKALVFPDKSTRGTLGNAALDALVVEDAERAHEGASCRVHPPGYRLGARQVQGDPPRTALA